MANFIEEVVESDLASQKYKKVAFRYPPEPNGYLHIGHAKAILINYGLAQKYNGTCNLRFDDTNPIKENDEFVNAIIEDMKWLGWQGEVFYASDYFERTLEIAKELIKKGLAFVDTSSSEQIKQMRGTLTTAGTNSPFRDRSVQDNLSMFEDMIAGKYNDGQAVLRAKIDMSNPNVNLRDPIIYRVLNVPHYRQGDKYKVYPMYDFAHPIQDAIEGITHSCCSLEFENNRPLYDWVVKHSADWKVVPHQYEFARLNIDGIKLSKRHLIGLVQQNIVDGWDDPRMPTIVGLRRRGYTPQSIKKFCQDIGVSKSNSTVDVAMLESCIRDELNSTAQRAMVAIDPIQLSIVNRDENWTETLTFDTVVDGKTLDSSAVSISNTLYIDRADFDLNPPPKYKRLTVGGFVRLKSAYIVKCTGFEKDSCGNVLKVFCEIVENSKSGQDKSGIKGAGVIHWVDSLSAIDVTCRHFYELFLQGDELNPDSKVEVGAKMDANFLEKADSFQFLRNGYYCKDRSYSKYGLVNPNVEIVFNKIVGLKDSFNNK